jgi:hypothetical protein
VNDAANVPSSDPRQRPPQVTTATRMFVGSLGLGILNSALLWPYLISKASVGFVLTIQITTFAIFGALAYQIWLGRNWARITAVVLGILNLPFYIPTLKFFLSVSFVAGCISLLQMALQVAALYLIFSKPGRYWFRPKASVA